MLVGVALSGVVTFLLLIMMTKALGGQHLSLLPRFDALVNGLSEINARLSEMQIQPPEHPLTGTVFLPTDIEAAALEKALLSSEDRAIRAAGGQPSARRVRTSDDRSPRAASTRPANASGRI